jgi:rod shape-determining protein MreC
MWVRLLVRHRRALSLACTLLIGFVLMTIQTRQPSEAVGLLHRGLLLAAAPLLKASAALQAGAVGLWRDYVDLRGLREENRGLRREVAALRSRVASLEEVAIENRRLHALLGMRERAPHRLAGAKVIGRDGSNWSRALIVDRGSKAGVARNMPVLVPEGLVGRVVEVTPWAAKVQLVTDPVSAVGALVQRTRAGGVLAGEVGGAARLRYLPLLADVRPGDRVLTSGEGGVFPKGMPLGEVAQVERRSGTFFQEALIAPSVDFSRVEEVLVLLEPPAADRPPEREAAR